MVLMMNFKAELPVTQIQDGDGKGSSAHKKKPGILSKTCLVCIVHQNFRCSVSKAILAPVEEKSNKFKDLNIFQVFRV
jgi:hypothetical protein